MDARKKGRATSFRGTINIKNDRKKRIKEGRKGDKKVRGGSKEEKKQRTKPAMMLCIPATIRF